MDMSQGVSINNASNVKQEVTELVLCSRLAAVGSSSAALFTFCQGGIPV